MPFVTIYIPFEVSEGALLSLTDRVIQNISVRMDVPMDWVEVFFPSDRLPMAARKAQLCQTVYVRIDTAMFHRSFFQLIGDLILLRWGENTRRAKEVTAALALAVQSELGYRHEVVAMICDFDPNLKTLAKAVP